MTGKDDWDLNSSTSDFSLDDDFGILESGDFELLDSFDGELIQTDIDEELAIESLDDLRLTEADLAEKPASAEGEPAIVSVSPEPEEEKRTEVIEPSTLVDERLSIVRRKELAGEEAQPEAEEKVPQAQDTEAAQPEEAPEVSEEMPEVPVSSEVASGTVEEVAAEAESVSASESLEETPSDVVEVGAEETAEEESAVMDTAAPTEESTGAVEAPENEGGTDMAQTVATREAEMKKALEALLEASPDFEGAAVVSADGFIIASALPEGSDEAKVGAMAAAILSLGERAAGEMGKGKLETVFVEGDNGYVLVTAVSDSVLLTVATSKYAKLGLVFYELRSVKDQLKKSLA
jgi:predicted regulator of Ras-like GTPase activity (Roadblock/LC7/MglB family)